MMNKLNILYMLISTIFTFVSCTRVKNKDLKVNILALTDSLPYNRRKKSYKGDILYEIGDPFHQPYRG